MTVTIPPKGQYTIDPAQSSVTFTAKHQFGLATVRGSFALRSGEIRVSKPVTASVVRVVVDAGSFASGNRTRDKQVKSATFLHVENHPNITFESTGVRVDEAGDWTLHGTLTARGSAAPIELAVADASVTGDELILTATTVVDRYAHDITAMKGMAGRRLWMSVQIRARRITSIHTAPTDTAATDHEGHP